MTTGDRWSGGLKRMCTAVIDATLAFLALMVLALVLTIACWE